MRVLYSFPHKLGADRICYLAWQMVNSLAAAGADLLVFPGAVHRNVAETVKVQPTLARGKFRIPYRILGTMRACALHDYIVSRRLEKLKGQIDIIHVWPLGALKTLQSAARLGIPTVLERCNAHTKFAYEVVENECRRLGVAMPRGHEHAYNSAILEYEEAEYQAADYILCPSDFVLQSFLNQGFSADTLLRHQYGYDEKVYYPDMHARSRNCGLTVLFVGGCAPRKGLHYALDAWLQSPAHKDGTFLIAGAFIAGYATHLSGQLSHSSVKVLGHRNDVPELMRKSDILVLPSIEEGSALVTSEARGSGCVLLVSEASGAICRHMENALVHPVGDVETLSQHLTLLYQDRVLLERLRSTSLLSVGEITWGAAGARLHDVYHQIITSEP